MVAAGVRTGRTGTARTKRDPRAERPAAPEGDCIATAYLIPQRRDPPTQSTPLTSESQIKRSLRSTPAPGPPILGARP
jgi:hypothetical protein